MSIGRAHVWSVGALALLLTSPATARGQHPESPSAAGYVTALNLGYNLDYAEALAAFREATARDPNNPALYRLAAATVWTQLLFEQGAVTVEDYLGEARAERPRLDAADRLVVTFHTNLDTALRLSASQLRDRPWDPEAHYQVGAAHSLLASYTATIEGRTAGSVGPARRAYREHSRVLDLDPQRTDAALTVGTYRYAIASLPRPMRVLARIAGFSSGRASGLALVEEAAAHASDAQPNALFVLTLLYNREKRYDAALRTIEDLQRRFPRNRLLWLEEAGTALRAGQAVRARAAAERGLAMLAQESRPKARGEESRWRHVYGASLLRADALNDAERELRAALSTATRDWVRGRVQLELGRLAHRRGDRAGALRSYRSAEPLCQRDKDHTCLDDLAALRATPDRHRPTRGLPQ